MFNILSRQGVQIETILRFHFTQVTAHAGEDVEQEEHSSIVGI